MRLIDAEALKTREVLDKLRSAEFDDEIESVIDSIPTAYDVEAKVTELEKLRNSAIREYERTCCTGGYEHDYADGASDAYDKAIDVTRDTPGLSVSRTGVGLQAQMHDLTEDRKKEILQKMSSIEAVLIDQQYDSLAQKFAYEAELQFLYCELYGHDRLIAYVWSENGDTLEITLDETAGEVSMFGCDINGGKIPLHSAKTLDELFETYFEEKEEERE